MQRKEVVVSHDKQELPHTNVHSPHSRSSERCYKPSSADPTAPFCPTQSFHGAENKKKHKQLLGTVALALAISPTAIAISPQRRLSSVYLSSVRLVHPP